MLDVQDGDVGRAAGLHQLERLGAGLGAQHTMARLAEAEGDQIANVGVVIDDEHAGHGEDLSREGTTDARVIGGRRSSAQGLGRMVESAR